MAQLGTVQKQHVFIPGTGHHSITHIISHNVVIYNHNGHLNVNPVEHTNTIHHVHSPSP